MLIYWALWNKRCRRRFEGLSLNAYALFLHVVSALRWQAFMIKPKRVDDSWGKEMLQNLKIGSPFSVVTKVKWIKWEPPPKSMAKLNVDGASKGSSGLSRGGVVLRNSKGHVVLAAAAFYGIGSNMRVECFALLDGLKLLMHYGLESYQILIEPDSQVLVQMVLGKVEIPWRLQRVLGEIRELLGKLQYQIRHVYREANAIANFLASFAIKADCFIDFSISDMLPLEGRLLLQQDQSSTPTARRRRVVFGGQQPEIL